MNSLRIQALVLCQFICFALQAAVPSPCASGECAHRGDLDRIYCDEDYDLVADPPKNPALLKEPSTLVFAYISAEDSQVYAEQLADFMRHLSTAAGIKVVYHPFASAAEAIEAMRQGRLHIVGFAPGPTCFAVNLAGYVPFAAKGDEKGVSGYSMLVLTRGSSPYRALADLRGKVVAHSTPASHSGHLAPLALLPFEGVVPGRDYRLAFSGGHDQSLLGLAAGDYDAACAASTVYERMSADGRINAADYRIIWRSALFPSSSLGHAHNLKPDLAARIRQAFIDYRFPPEMREFFGGADRFHPISYQKDYEVIRAISRARGDVYDRRGLKRNAAVSAPAAGSAAPTGGAAKR